MSWWRRDKMLDPEDGERTLETDLASVLHFWRMDDDVNVPAHVLATCLIRQMGVLRMMQDERQEAWEAPDGL